MTAGRTNHTAFAQPSMKSDELNYFVIKADGQRSGRCFGRYNGSKPAAEAACKPGETVSEGRVCPYPGCYGDATMRPPCALCYE